MIVIYPAVRRVNYSENRDKDGCVRRKKGTPKNKIESDKDKTTKATTTTTAAEAAKSVANRKQSRPPTGVDTAASVGSERNKYQMCWVVPLSSGSCRGKTLGQR